MDSLLGFVLSRLNIMFLQLSSVIIHPVLKFQTVLYIEEAHKLPVVMFQNICPGLVHIYFYMKLGIQRNEHIAVHADNIRAYNLFDMVQRIPQVFPGAGFVAVRPENPNRFIPRYSFSYTYVIE